jgi:hypothetical protein
LRILASAPRIREGERGSPPRRQMAEHLENKTPSARAPWTPLRLVSAAVAIGIAALAITWAVVWNGSSGSNSTAATSIKPVALSADGLRTLAALVPQPIYWAGPRKHFLYELTRQTNGYVYVRYLPPGVNAGAPGAKYLVIATYPVRNAYHALLSVAHGGQIRIPRGGAALVNAKDPKSVLIAFPGTNYQVEVFDPSPATARQVAVSGSVLPAP